MHQGFFQIRWCGTERQFGSRQPAQAAVFVKKSHFGQHVLDFAAIGPGVHIHRPAHCARNAVGKLKPGQPAGADRMAQRGQRAAGADLDGGGIPCSVQLKLVSSPVRQITAPAKPSSANSTLDPLPSR